MRVLIYEGCRFIAQAMADVLKNHELLVVTEVSKQDNSQLWFGTDLASCEVAIKPTQFDLAFVDRQFANGSDSLEFVTDLVNAGLPCVGTSALPKCNEKIKTITRLALSKVVVISALRSGRFTLSQAVAQDLDSIPALEQFEQDLSHPNTPEMNDLRKETEEFLKLHLEGNL